MPSISSNIGGVQYDSVLVKEWFDRHPYRYAGHPSASRPLDSIISELVRRSFLRQYLKRQFLVLEVGAGCGEVTRELVGFCDGVHISDLSPEQLARNQARATEEGWHGFVVGTSQLDITAIPASFPQRFHAVVAFGVLSYTLDKVPDALNGIGRILEPGGVLIGDLMSYWGTLQSFLPAILEWPEHERRQLFEQALFVPTGTMEPKSPPLKLYTSEMGHSLLQGCGFEPLRMSTSNVFTAGRWLSLLDSTCRTEEEFLHLEMEACSAPGNLDAGDRIFFAAQKRQCDLYIQPGEEST